MSKRSRKYKTNISNLKGGKNKSELLDVAISIVVKAVQKVDVVNGVKLVDPLALSYFKEYLKFNNSSIKHLVQNKSDFVDVKSLN